MSNYTVYGIKNCDTIKKALTWLDKKKVKFDFHDYKLSSITEAQLKDWCKQVGWEVLVNKRGGTWRQLDDATKNSITGEVAAIKQMMKNNSLIKRPVIEKNGKILMVGFDEKEYLKKF